MILGTLAGLYFVLAALTAAALLYGNLPARGRDLVVAGLLAALWPLPLAVLMVTGTYRVLKHRVQHGRLLP